MALPLAAPMARWPTALLTALLLPPLASGDKFGNYFQIYAHPDIHRQMLQDRQRTEAYGNALLKEPAVVKGKVVMDFGCGTGILSLYAAKAGARKVICVEASDLAKVTEKVVKANNFSKVIKVVKARHDKLKLPGKVDVIVSEWMGFLLVMEDMLAHMLEVRDAWLKPGGVVWPRYAQLWISAYSDPEWWAENIDYWKSNPYGFDLSPLDAYAFGDNQEWPWPIRGQWRPQGLVGKECLLSEWDLQTLALPKNFVQTSSFESAVHGRPVHGLMVWFDVVFDHPSGGNVTLSTHPAAGAQHWGQIFWPLKGAPLEAAGEELRLEGRVRLKRSPPAWDFSLGWRAPPLVDRITEAHAPGLMVEHLTTADEWTQRKSYEAFLEKAEREAAAPRKAASQEL